MKLKLDLHIHSELSLDGKMTTQEIVAQAKAKGLQGVAICNHDAVLEDVPELSDFLVIPGIELSTTSGHLLGLFVTKEIKTQDFAEAVSEIHAQGGIAVLAHPFEHSRDSERLEAISPMLDGIEVFNSRATRKIPEANALAKAFADAHGLRHFGGSDSHVLQEIGGCTVEIEAEALTLQAVKDALLSGTAIVIGKLGKARYVALSQLNKRKRTNANAAAYLKWLLFAAKCCVQDIFRG